ncbi:unnamed protein product [Musa acuminata subsp. malaccensis]|uniref:(wild Malaysian banana) hypothetical protein n=1 Tax=Musa acuminata subsp. malaccensis TaxID=214687 RepID=A0A804HW09_MUSAM|nr:PREDICTED: uncharacterized protein LOC103999195 [Musa acuminata subsp. malaccensis]CAG1860006.1 unnamed protein product [Musa acuminata subsp. malaccensis]
MGKRENKAGELGDESEGGDEKTFEEGVWDTHPRLRRRQWTDTQNSLAIKYRHYLDVGFGFDRPTTPSEVVDCCCGDHAQEDLTRVVQARPLCRIRRRSGLGSPHGTARKFYKSQDTRHASMRTLGIACSPDVQQKWTEDRKYDPRLEDVREN